MSGIGDVLAPARKLPRMGIALVNPGVAVATPSVFRTRAGPFSGSARLPGQDWPDAASLVETLHATRNDLEAPALGLAPAIGEALAALVASPDCLLARMSGSGATCFGLFPTPAAAREAARTIVRRAMVGLGRRAYRRIAVLALRARPGDLSRRLVGASPSGKATDFDSVIRRFDPSRPSQSPASGGFCRGPTQFADRGFDVLPALQAR